MELFGEMRSITYKGHVRNNEAIKNITPGTFILRWCHLVFFKTVHFSYFMTILSHFGFIIFNMIIKMYQQAT